MKKAEKWKAIYEELTGNTIKSSVSDDIESLALAAYMIGKDEESFELFERSHHKYLEEGNVSKAVRCAFWLGLIFLNSGHISRGSGWIAKAERLYKNEASPSSERGLLMIPDALRKLSSGDAEQARKLFEQATVIGEQFGDIDLILIGRLGQGQSWIQEDEVLKGVKLFDELMITMEQEEVFPIAVGIIYCAVIETYLKIWDLTRAHDWTLALTKWCDAQPDIVPFRGQCLVRRGQIYFYQGQWQKALEEVQSACSLLTRPPGESAAGEAFYFRGEIYRLLGRVEHAEKSYFEAAKWGRVPQPGFALFRLGQGLSEAAETTIMQTLSEIRDPKKRTSLLPGVVKIMIARKNIKEARVASDELNHLSTIISTPFLQAKSLYCRGKLLLAEEGFQNSLQCLNAAMEIWEMLDMPYESARTREARGLIYLKLNDKDNAALEFASARWVYEQLEANPDLERIKGYIPEAKKHFTYGLTLRELQVLHRVASGKTNKAIARELFISERTVDRHVSNMLNKMGVSSRVEATALAFKKRIFMSDPHR